MSETKTIQTTQDVADYLGAAHPTNESISRRVYKDTSCGACAVVETEVVMAERDFRARFERSIVGDVLCAVYRSGRKAEIRDLPKSVKDYLCVVDQGRYVVFDEKTCGPLADLTDGITRRGLSTFVTFTCKVPVGQRTVFRVGSIVEGVDAEVFETVALPCTSDQIDKAIEVVESAANDIWQDTHGCEDCNTDEHDCRVNPDCQSCGGDGVVI